MSNQKRSRGSSTNQSSFIFHHWFILFIFFSFHFYHLFTTIRGKSWRWLVNYRRLLFHSTSMSTLLLFLPLLPLLPPPIASLLCVAATSYDVIHLLFCDNRKPHLKWTSRSILLPDHLLRRDAPQKESTARRRVSVAS